MNAASAKAIEHGLESVRRAQSSVSIPNDVIVIQYFSAKGVLPAEIRPRENVFTFNGWKALGRFVRKGEHGCALATIATRVETDQETGEETITGRRVTTYVFHISQTEAAGS